jgi:hypothetical protein
MPPEIYVSLGIKHRSELDEGFCEFCCNLRRDLCNACRRCGECGCKMPREADYR